MTLSTRLIWPAAVVVVVAIAAVRLPGGAGTPPAASQPGESAADAAVALSAQGTKEAGIEVTPARFVERAESIAAPGVVALNERRTARLGAIVEGVAVDVPVQPGDAVAAGAPLATLLSHLFHDAWAAYFKALAERRVAERDVAYARMAHERAERLLADKAMSPQEVERAAADRLHAEQMLVSARAEVVRTEQDLEHYGITPREDADVARSDRVVVRSPIGGAVIERLVSPGAAVTPGSPLVVVSDLATVWVQAEVDELHLSRLARGREAFVRTPAFPDQTFEGVIDAVGDVVNRTTRRVAVRLVVPNPDRRLRPEMFVDVSLGVGAPRQTLVVPSSAVQTVDGAPVVFVRQSDGRFVRRDVRLGTDDGRLAEVLAGLAEGDAVVSTGAFLLKSAMTAPVEEP